MNNKSLLISDEYILFFFDHNGLSSNNREKQKDDHETHFINMLEDVNESKRKLSTLYNEKNTNSIRERFLTAIFQYSDPSLDINKLRNTSQSKFNSILNFCLNQWDLFLVSSGDINCCSLCSPHSLYYKNKVNSNVVLLGSKCIKNYAMGSNIDYDYRFYKKAIQCCYNCGKTYASTELIGKCCSECYLYRLSEKRSCISCFGSTDYIRCEICTEMDNPPITIFKDIKPSNEINHHVIQSLYELSRRESTLSDCDDFVNTYSSKFPIDQAFNDF